MDNHATGGGLISVVVPAYNAEKTVRRCIESVLAQTYQEFELIIVDDGSTDGTGEICKEYAKDERIRYIYQENGGEGAARNMGLDHARGDYVTFLDSDDALPANTLRVFSSHGMYDSVIGGLCVHYGERTEVSAPAAEKEYRGRAIREAVLDRETFRYLGGVASKVFRMEIIRKNHIRFNKNKVGADTDFIYNFYAEAEKICIVKEVLYDYYILGNSMSHGIIQEPWKNSRDLYEDVIKAFGFRGGSRESFIILMRSVKPALLYSLRGGNGEFLRVCEQIYRYLEENGLDRLTYSTNLYEKATYRLLVKRRFHALRLMMKARAMLLPKY